MMEGMQGKTCGCPHHKVVPVVVILFALTFLLNAFDVVTASFTQITWPILVGIVGIMKLMEGSCKCC